MAAPQSAKTPPKVADLIRQRGQLLSELHRNLEQAHQRMRESANKKRRHVEFEVGDWVWLKLQPCHQHSVAKPLSAKLARRFYGPFEILQRVGPVAYRLKLPEGSKIHDVFHVSLLREFVADGQTPQHMDLPEEFKGGRPIARPVCFLDSQIMWNNGTAEEHVLFRWSDGVDAPTWEPLAVIRRRFPNLSLEAKELATSHETEEPGEEEAAGSEGVMAGKEASPAAVTSKRTLRPRDKLKQPQKFVNYIAK